MVNPKELRISNYLYDEDGAIIKINGFAPHSHSTRCDEEEGCVILFDIYGQDGNIRQGYENESSNCNPIELTPEWLGRCGFMQENNAWHINKPLSYTEAYFSLFDNNLCKGNLDLQLNGSYYMLLPRIKYVHQLQNIYYFLSGEELTIKTD